MKNVLKISNTTTVQFIKEGTFRYVQQVCDEGIGVRYGSAIASYIEAEAYYMTGGVTEVNEGDVIYYYQQDSVDQNFNPTVLPTDHIIGRFTVERCVRGNKTYSFVAYDNIKKLDADYSARLLAIKAQFPMYVSDFLDDIQTFMSNLGVNVTVSSLYAYTYGTDAKINYFYTNGITVRDILSSFAETEFKFLCCYSNGNIGFADFDVYPYESSNRWWDADRYIISPTDQTTYTGTATINGVPQTVTLVPVFYKENGFEHEGYTLVAPDAFHFYRSDGYELYGDYSTPTPTNSYNIYNNIYADNVTLIDEFYWINVCTGYDVLHNMLTDYSVTPFEAHLFPFRNPFQAGQILPHIIDADGNQFQSVIMKMVTTDSETVLTCTGQEYYHQSSYGNYDTDSNVQTLAALVNNLSEQVQNKVSKDGDTMTGLLIAERPSNSSAIAIKSTTDDRETTPASNQALAQLRFIDNGNDPYASIRARHLTNGSWSLWLYSLNANSVTNGLELGIDSAGNRFVDLTQAPWLKALGLGDANGALPLTIAQGGTGATTADLALRALNGYARLTDSITSSQTLTITSTGTSVYLIFTSGNNSNNMGAWSVWVNSASATPIVKNILAASNVTLTTGSGKVMLSCTSSLYVYVLCLQPTTSSRLTLTKA